MRLQLVCPPALLVLPAFKMLVLRGGEEQKYNLTFWIVELGIALQYFEFCLYEAVVF